MFFVCRIEDVCLVTCVPSIRERLRASTTSRAKANPAAGAAPTGEPGCLGEEEAAAAAAAAVVVAWIGVGERGGVEAVGCWGTADPGGDTGRETDCGGGAAGRGGCWGVGSCGERRDAFGE